MGALFDAAGELLTATLTAAPVETQNRLITAYINHPNGLSVASENWLFRLQHSDTHVYSSAYTNATGLAIVRGHNGGGTYGEKYQSGVLVGDDTWRLFGCYAGGNNGASNALNAFALDAGFYSTTNIPFSTSSARELTGLVIGSQSTVSSGRWRGYIAEFAIWTPADEEEAQDILTELLTKKPNAVTTASPIFYAPLESDNTVVVGGVTLSVLGTTTFDAGVHPSLSGGSPPDAPTAGTVSSITHNSATANWTDNSDDETGFKVEYGESSGGTVGSWSAASGSPAAADAESLALTGLSPETTYKFRVAATNANGDSDWDESAEFTTEAAPVKGVSIATGQTSMTGLRWAWFDGTDPGSWGAPAAQGTGESTDGSNDLEISLTGTTLDIGDWGYLVVNKEDTAKEDDVVFAGRLQVADIS